MENWEKSLEKSVEPELTPVMELCKQQNINRATAHRRMKRLQIKPWRKGKYIFLDREQVGYMNGLNEYYQKTGRWEGFPIPKPTGPWEDSTPSNILPIESEDNQNLGQQSTENFPIGNLQKIVKAHKERCRAAQRRGQVSVQNWQQKLRLLIVRQGSTQIQFRSGLLKFAESINA